MSRNENGGLISAWRGVVRRVGLPLYSIRCICRSRHRIFGAASAHQYGQEIIMPRFLNAVLLGAALSVPVAIAPTILSAQAAVVYHDNGHNDDHQWNNHEDRAYRMYVKENHRRYRDFAKINENDRQAYWGWRHEHSDAVLKIDVR
jgi:hypothetical protein